MRKHTVLKKKENRHKRAPNIFETKESVQELEKTE